MKFIRVPKRLHINMRIYNLLLFGIRNRPEIRLNPVPAGFSAPNSGSGSGPVSSRFAGFQPEFEKTF